MESQLTRRCEACGYRFESATDFCPVDRRVLPPADPSVADLGSYRLTERLRDGGMGAVYRAVHKRLGRTVAIKLLHKDLTSDRGIINRFFHEARAANTIRHEHVIEVYDFAETGQDVYFVMEFLKGVDLHDAIHHRGNGPMDPGRAASIVEQIASALHATHARNIIHRDLKPENVFLCERDGSSDFVKVFDFGVAKLDRFDGRSTVEGAVLGTPEYMAPEQARGGKVDSRADIYSLGCIAYEMLTRRQAFGGGTQSEILIRQMTLEPARPRSIVPALPEALDAAIMSALAKDPADRPPTALSFAERVARAVGRELEHAAAFRTPTRPTPARASTLVLRDDRRPWKPIALGTIAATLLTGALVATAKLRHGPPPPQPVGTAAVQGAPPPSAGMAPAPAPTVTVLLQSVPSGAEIVDEKGAPIGLTPHDLVMPAGGERQVRFQKPGFRPVERRFRARTDSVIAVRLEADPARSRSRTARARSESARLDSRSATLDPFGATWGPQRGAQTTPRRAPLGQAELPPGESGGR
jgi:serine/threonine protein kinase